MSDVDETPEHLRKVFIGGLHPDTTDESLRQYFTKYGEIVDCIVMRDSNTKRSRGFGFVTFDKPDCVDRLQNEKPHTLDTKKVDTKRVVPKNGDPAQPRSVKEQKVQKLFVGGLKDEVSEDDIRSTFEQFGEIEKVETFIDKETGRRRGFGFVTFTDFDSADKCVYLPDKKMSIGMTKVDVKKAISQEEMKSSNVRGGRGGGFGGRGGGGGRGRFGGRGGYGDFNQGYNQGYGNGYGSGGGGGYGGGGYGGGPGYGGGDSYGNGYGNGGSYGGGGGGGNWGGSQGGHWNGPGGGGGGGYNGPSGGYGGGYGGGSGGGPMRGGYNRNRPTPYGGGGGRGGGGGWRN